MVATLGASVMGVDALLTTPTKSDSIGSDYYIGFALHMGGILMAWYAAHRSMIALNHEQKPPAPLRFIWSQSLNMMMLSSVVSIALFPLITFWVLQNPEMSFEDVLQKFNKVMTYTTPLIVALYARLILMAPLLARGEKKTFWLSRRATKGHFWHIFIILSLSLLPAVAGYGLAVLVRAVPMLALLFYMAGNLISLALTVIQAEKAYAELPISPLDDDKDA